MIHADKSEGNSSKAERKYYQLDIDMGLPDAPLQVWVNEKRLRENFLADRNQPFLGLVFSESPKIAFDREDRRGQLRDVYFMMLGIWLVADRVKSLFESIDSDAFAFVKADVDYRNFDKLGHGFWFCDLVRVLDCIDEQKSALTYQENVSFKVYQSLIDVRVLPDVVGGAHAFRLKKAFHKQIVDDVFVDAINAEKITGFRFIKIQR
jgi:hypothetical protein